jgi:hypothetical protein
MGGGRSIAFRVTDTMKEEMSPSTVLSLTRRAFMRKLAVAGAALGTMSMISGGSLAFEKSAAPRGRRREVVSFHMDQPYLDTTGRATPYHPPRGMRSAAPVVHLSEKAFRSTHHSV